MDNKSVKNQRKTDSLSYPPRSLSSGHLDWKVRKIGIFQSFILLREIVLRLILEHFPHIPQKEKPIEIPVEVC